jgi:hypothetical protein
MDVAGIASFDREDAPLLAATAAIGIGSLLVLVADAEGLIAGALMVGGTAAFLWLTLQEVEVIDGRVIFSTIAMILGSVFVGFDITILFDFDGPLGAALFLFGAVGVRSSVIE